MQALEESALLTRALAYAGGSHSLTDVQMAIADGRCQEWVGEESVLVTEIKQTPQQRILLFWLAAGNLQELRAMATPICAWGKQQGCVKAQLIGRLGWERSDIRGDGWELHSVVMEKRLE